MATFNIYKRHWPSKKYTLYSMSDDPGAIHMQRGAADNVSILMRIDWKREEIVILAIEMHKDEKSAVTWYVEEKEKRNVS